MFYTVLFYHFLDLTPLKPYDYVLPDFTFKNSTFCPPTVYLSVGLELRKKTRIIYLRFITRGRLCLLRGTD